MDVGATLILVLLAFWATVLLFAAAGAVVYHWPVDSGGETRRGFDVLPRRPAQ